MQTAGGLFAFNTPIWNGSGGWLTSACETRTVDPRQVRVRATPYRGVRFLLFFLAPLQTKKLDEKRHARNIRFSDTSLSQISHERASLRRMRGRVRTVCFCSCRPMPLRLLLKTSKSTKFETHGNRTEKRQAARRRSIRCPLQPVTSLSLGLGFKKALSFPARSWR